LRIFWLGGQRGTRLALPRLGDEKGEDWVMMSLATAESFGGVHNNASASQAVSFEAGMTLREIEKAVILETLKRQSFNRTRAARVLGIGIRTLQRKLKQYKLETSISFLDA